MVVMFGGSKDVAFNQEISDLLGQVRIDVRADAGFVQALEPAVGIVQYALELSELLARPDPLIIALDEVREVAAQGTTEVVLLGQTVNSYHDGEMGFADLLRDLGGHGDRRVSPHRFDPDRARRESPTRPLNHSFPAGGAR